MRACAALSPGLELWQFHGPSTRRAREDGGSRVYLHLTARPYERVVVRGIPIRRVERVRLLSDGRELPFSVHPRLSDIHARTEDAFGELRIAVDPGLLDPLCTVLAVDLAAPPNHRRRQTRPHGTLPRLPGSGDRLRRRIRDQQ